MVVADSPATASPQSGRMSYFRTLFFVASAWNVVGAIMGLLFLDPLARLAWPGTSLLGDPISVQFAMMVFGLIGVLGLGYALVAFDPGRNRALVLTAAIGKPVVLAFGVYYSWGAASVWLLLPALGVLLFTASFWWFLISTRDLGWY